MRARHFELEPAARAQELRDRGRCARCRAAGRRRGSRRARSSPTCAARRRRGAGADAALRQRGAPPAQLRVPPEQLDGRARRARPRGARRARHCDRRTCGASREAELSRRRRRSSMPQGQPVTLRELPVARAGVYVPGGRAAYPSSVVMCCVPARVAGVEQVAVATPPGTGRARQRRGPRGLRAVRGRRGLPDGRRTGDRGACLRDRHGRRRST